ncbi:YajG family lipoprotein [Aliidiomarina halalkaliphila]|uniref:YajG family lipoprotein n=1 Tax=Aliidiomarina halalkaliphila TaxID=2593535 RepID=UPI00163DB65A|nr:YajG family lipoprotein [Aliidiomarina halalkaliphila]
MKAKLYSIKRVYFSALTVLFLSACGSTPGPTPSALQLSVQSSVVLAESQPLQLTVSDRRTQNHLLRVEHSLDHAEFATATQPVATLISEELQRTLPIVGQANTVLHIYIDHALVRAVRRGNEYEVEHRVVLSAVATQGNAQVRSEMTTTMGPQTVRRLDYGRIERDFNRNLNTTLDALLRESELRQFLQVGSP